VGNLLGIFTHVHHGRLNVHRDFERWDSFLKLFLKGSLSSKRINYLIHTYISFGAERGGGRSGGGKRKRRPYRHIPGSSKNLKGVNGSNSRFCLRVGTLGCLAREEEDLRTGGHAQLLQEKRGCYKENSYQNT